ncbi:MAG: helix-turn-helix domain-containing protein [Bacteroidaceae bacterium]|nr:helix-turn-helix domain-containing protein [Bacteroidaceae bacterium]
MENDNKFIIYLETKIQELFDKKLSEIKEFIMKSKDEEKYLTVNEVVEKYHISKTTLWRMAKGNYIIPLKMGSRNLYCETELKKIISNR